MRLRVRDENLLVKVGEKKIWLSKKMIGSNSPVTPRQACAMVTHAYVTRTYASSERVMAVMSFVLLDGGSVSTVFPGAGNPK